MLDTQGHSQYLQVWAKIPDFEKQTGITVNLVKAATTDDLQQKVLQGVAQPRGPYDVVTVPDFVTGAASLRMAPLGPLIEKSGTVAEWQGQYPAWAQKADTFGGQIRYVPFYAGATAVIYRKSMFEDPANKAAFQKKFGYALPDPPTTPQQLLDAATFFTGNGKYGIVFPASGSSGNSVFDEPLFRAGLTLEDPQGYSLWGAQHTQNQALALSVATYMQDLIYKYKAAPPAVTGMDTTAAGAYFANCGAAMYLDLAYLTWSTVKASVSKCGDVGSFTMPDFASNGGSRVSYWEYGIPSNSSNQAAAWKFIQWISSDENVELAATGPNGTFVPASLKAANAVSAKGSIPPAVAKAVSEGITYPLLPETPNQGTTLQDYMEKLLGDKLTPAQWLQQSSADVDKLRTDS